MSSDSDHLPHISRAKRAADKLSRIPIKVKPTKKAMRKPSWIRAKAPVSPEIGRLKSILRENQLHTVCEEANCPNLGECFGQGTATFMIMGDVCTRRCPFCDVAHGRPVPLDRNEPRHLAKTIAELGLSYVVITSVDRDDLLDGGAGHFVDCIQMVRQFNPGIELEILTPDFRGRIERALDTLAQALPDVFNHNLETVSRLYPAVRPGADYRHSLNLLGRFAKAHPEVLTKSGLMLGLGEQRQEIEQVMSDLREQGCRMLTLGQYLQPTLNHLPVKRFVPPDEFDELAQVGRELGFDHVASGPMVRSSYHADQQAKTAISTL